MIEVGSKVRLVNQTTATLAEQFGLCDSIGEEILAGRPATVVNSCYGDSPRSLIVQFDEHDDMPAIDDEYLVYADEVEEISEFC